MKPHSLLLLIGFIFATPMDGAFAENNIPPKTVVLTFDDSVKSHRTYVGPLLEELGFGATFYVTHLWMDDTENFMTWRDIADLHEMGFEIGNHSWTHAGFNTPKAAARMEGELALIDHALKQVGVPKPVTFGWPGNGFGPEGVAVLRRLGYKFARRGMQPEVPYGEIKVGTYYDPELHDPLLVPSAGDAYPNWDLEHFKKVVDPIPEAKVCVVQFHGVPDVAHPWVHTPPDSFQEYMNHLKDGGFNVIALRDLENYFDPVPRPDDPNVGYRYRRSEDPLPLPEEQVATQANLDFWTANMARHGYTEEEREAVAGQKGKELPEAKPARDRDSTLQVLPYPGGRHPRIGFLDGAIDPQRGTKVSLFAPWEDGGYVVLDLPEAIWSNLGLTYLAHTHIPTIWDESDEIVPNVDWTVHEDGHLSFERSLPNGIQFGSSVVPEKDGARLEHWLENGTKEKLTGMKIQVCAMLKGAKGFIQQDNENKRFEAPVAVAKSESGGRWVLLAFERCGRAWGNTQVPCLHADPVLPDAEPGERVGVKGRIWFYRGNDATSEIENAKSEFSIYPADG
jgi:peptidoglycan/xylan/chitin deacetylase (PgdA/CDA1 family)